MKSSREGRYSVTTNELISRKKKKSATNFQDFRDENIFNALDSMSIRRGRLTTFRKVFSSDKY